ncbi:NADPH:quinone reductase [Streptomyces sp. NK08204]|uniref:NADPH:quinone reductase n=1 Tax=Streptomyces sp. NK08204 TaxID=2873260 RepID=UPI001CEC80F4|nr:NADPH:quinone reductase [Streptomyces sp. NK08204]
MKAIVYTTVGNRDVLRMVDRPVPQPGPGEVRVRVAISGVNATDWKCRRFGHADGRLMFPEVIPHHDGSGVIDAVGPGVPAGRVGQRVWLWESAWRRAHGTAAEFVVLPSRQAVELPPGASLELGASIGLPALAAHRCLTSAQHAPARLGPGTLAGRTVLVAGGAGAVGHAAVQLATWCGASVIATVGAPEKEKLARAAGAGHVVNHRSGGTAAEIRAIAPAGVDLVVEVAPSANLGLDLEVLAPGGTVAAYGTEGDGEVRLPTRLLMGRNLRYQFVLALTLSPEEKDAAVADVAAAVADGALGVGEGAGLPLHRYPLHRTGDAHDAVEGGTTGKVLIDIG